MGNKAQRSYRLDTATIEAVEAWARDHGKSNTEAVEEMLRRGMEGTHAEAAAHDRAEAAGEQLEANLADLRAHVATLTEQLAAKDRQIAERDAQIRGLMDIADHAQQLHGAAVAGLISTAGAEAAGADEDADKGEDDRGGGSAAQEPQERPAGLWARIKAALMGY